MPRTSLAALLRRQPRFQRRADQLIPEQRDLLRPLPAFHRVLIEGVHHVLTPIPSSEGSARQVLPGNDPRDDPGPTGRCVRGNSCWNRHPPQPGGQPGERSRPPLDAAATCHAVTGPITPAVPNRAVTAAVAAPNAASTSRHGDPSAFGTAWSTPASRATTVKCTRTASSRVPHPPQPAADRAGRHAQQHPDPAGDPDRPPAPQRRADHLGGVGPPQQHRDRQQHVRDQTPRAPGPPRPQRADPTHPTWPGPTPRREHPRAARATELPARQPGLDPNLICLYRDQRVPPCIQHGPPAAVFPDLRREGRCLHSDARHTDGADHQDQIPRHPSPPSATPLTVRTPVVVIRRDVQHTPGPCGRW